MESLNALFGPGCATVRPSRDCLSVGSAGGGGGGNALLNAVRAGNTSLVAALLNESTEELEKADRSGFTPLHHASLLGFVPIGRLLLKHGADANKLTKVRDPPAAQELPNCSTVSPG